MELGPTDEGMKNGHMAKDCPLKANIARFGDQHEHWMHGPCTEDKKMSQEEFNLLTAHRDGLHEGQEDYACCLCVAELEKYRDETLANLKKYFIDNYSIPSFASLTPPQPEDAVPVEPLPAPFCRTCGDEIFQTVGPDGIWMHTDPGNTCGKLVR